MSDYIHTHPYAVDDPAAGATILSPLTRVPKSLTNLPCYKQLQQEAVEKENVAMAVQKVLVRFQIIRNARIERVGKSQSCMVCKLRIIWKQTVRAAVVVGDGRTLLKSCRLEA